MANGQIRSIKVNKEELSWLLKGYEVRTTLKFKEIGNNRVHYFAACSVLAE
jgi:hypothetical protein